MIKTEDFEWRVPVLTALPSRVHRLGDRGLLEEPHKRCYRCGDDLPATREFFYADHDEAGHLSKRCKACQLEWRYGRHSAQQAD